MDINGRIASFAEIQAWRSPTSEQPISGLDYAQLAGNAALFFSYASLFKPQLIERFSRYFLEDRYSSGVFQEWAERGETTSSIQRIMNRVSIASLLQHDEPSHSLIEDTAATLADIWRSTLPDGVQIEVLISPEDRHVTFYQTD